MTYALAILLGVVAGILAGMFGVSVRAGGRAPSSSATRSPSGH